MKSRPLGITVLSVLLMLNMAQYVVHFVLSIANPQALRALLLVLSPGGSGPATMHLGMGKFLPLYYAVMIVVVGVFALGFWRLWNWVRLAALALMGLSLIAGVAQGFRVLNSGSFTATAVLLARLGVTVLIGWYLLSAKVRDAYRLKAAATMCTLRRIHE